MSGVFPAGTRPDQWSTLGDHQRRIQALEAVPSSGSENDAVFQRLSTQFSAQFSTDSQVAPLVQDWEFGGWTFTAGSDPSTPATWQVPVTGYYAVEITCDALYNTAGIDQLVMELSGWPDDNSAPFDSYLSFDSNLPFGTQFRAPLAISGQIHVTPADVLTLTFQSSDEWLVGHLIVSMVLIAPPADGVIGTGFVQFNSPNTELANRYLDITTNDSDTDGYGVHVNDDSGGNGSLYEAEEAILIRRQDGSVSILIGDGTGGITVHSADKVLIDAASFEIAASTTIDGGGNAGTNFADGVNPTDLATVGQIVGGTGIEYDTANSGNWLDIETVGVDGDGYGVQIIDTDPTSNGIKVESTLGGQVLLQSAADITLFIATFAARVNLAPTGVSIGLPSAGSFAVQNSSVATVLSTSEATGVTTGTFDGGSP